MKSIKMMALIALSLACTLANASTISAHDYKCILPRLDAYNSSIYYSITPSEIDSILLDPSDARYSDVARFTKACDLAAAGKLCGGKLEAQIIGKAIVDECTDGCYYGRPTYRIGSFRQFQVNGLCPLDIDTARDAVLFMNGNTHIVNGEVSGVLVYDPMANSFHLE